MSSTDVSTAHRSEPPGAASDGSLKGNLTTLQLLLTVLAFNAPMAVVVAFAPVVIGYGNGLGAPVAYAAAAVVVALFAVGFLKMARHVENPGGFYSFVSLGLGREAGLGASFLAFVCYYVILLGSYALGGVLLQGFVTGTLHGPGWPWWTWSLVLQVVTWTLGYFSLDLSARVMAICLGLEALFIVAYDGVVVAKGGASGLEASSFHFSSITSGSVGIALMFAMLCFSGFEVTAVFRDEVRDPERSVPRAAFGFIVVIGVVYAASTWVIIQALGPADAVSATATDPTGAVLGSVQAFMGTVALDLATALLCTSGFATMLAVHNVVTRYVFNLGADGILPKRLGIPHPRFGSPHRGSVVTACLTAVGFVSLLVMHADPSVVYAQLSGMFGYALVVLLILTTISVALYLGRSRPQGTTAWHRLVAPLLSLVGLVVTLWLATKNISLLLGVGTGGVVICLGILYGSALLGAIYAAVLKRRRPEVYARIGRQ